MYKYTVNSIYPYIHVLKYIQYQVIKYFYFKLVTCCHVSLVQYEYMLRVRVPAPHGALA